MIDIWYDKYSVLWIASLSESKFLSNFQSEVEEKSATDATGLIAYAKNCRSMAGGGIPPHCGVRLTLFHRWHFFPEILLRGSFNYILDLSFAIT